MVTDGPIRVVPIRVRPPRRDGIASSGFAGEGVETALPGLRAAELEHLQLAGSDATIRDSEAAAAMRATV